MMKLCDGPLLLGLVMASRPGKNVRTNDTPNGGSRIGRLVHTFPMSETSLVVSFHTSLRLNSEKSTELPAFIVCLTAESTTHGFGRTRAQPGAAEENPLPLFR